MHWFGLGGGGSQMTCSEQDAEAAVAKALDCLAAERRKRPAPHLDDKVLTSWNGLMVTLYCNTLTL